MEFENVLVLDEVSFAIPEGILTGVVGPNGGGKSTLFNALVGLQRIVHGQILIHGMPPGDLKGVMSYVPQRELVNWRFPLSVKDVVSLGIAKKRSFPKNFGFATDENLEESLRKVDMWENRNMLVSDLSGGQRQRTFIARALSQEAGINVLRDLRDEGKTILVATHDLNSLSDRFDEVLCINRHICAHGEPESVFTREVLTELYGSHGEMFADHQLGSHDHVS